MKWQGIKKQPGIHNGLVYVPVTYTEQTALAPPIEEVYRIAVVVPDWPDALMRAKEAELNGLSIAGISLGPAAPAPAVPPVDPAKQALDAWLAQGDALLKMKASFAAATTAKLDTKVTQADIDAAYANLKAGYLPAYEPYLTRFF